MSSERDEGSVRRAGRRCGSAAALLLGSLVGAASGAGAGWNESVVGVELHRMIAQAGTEYLWISEQTKSDVFYVGEQIAVACLVRATKRHPSQNFSYTHEYLRVAPGTSVPKVYLSTQLLSSKQGPMDTGRLIDIQTAHSPGSWQYGCRLIADDENPADNGPVLRQLMVLPKQPGVAGLLPVPAPQILHPAPGQRFTPSAASPVPIKVRLPDTPFGAKPNLVEYAKATGDKETWQLEIVRRGQGSAKGFETTVGKFEGPLTAMEFAAETLTADWFAKNGGAGLYAARVWIAQRRQALHVFNGPSARVEFEIVAPVVLDAQAVAPSNQPVLATGSVPGTEPLRRARDGGAPPLRPMAAPGDARSTAPAWQAPAVRSDALRSQLPAVQSPTARGSPPAQAVNTAPADADVTRLMRATSCFAGTGGLRFSCTTRGGFDRCEAMRRERKVEACVLNERR